MHRSTLRNKINVGLWPWQHIQRSSWISMLKSISNVNTMYFSNQLQYGTNMISCNFVPTVWMNHNKEQHPHRHTLQKKRPHCLTSRTGPFDEASPNTTQATGVIVFDQQFLAFLAHLCGKNNVFWWVGKPANIEICACSNHLSSKVKK